MATGQWDPMAAAAASRGLLRASDAEREQVIDALKTAFAQGLITRDELGTRAGQALASRTYAELTAVTAGLTASHPPPQPARAHPKRINKKAVTAGTCAIVLAPALAAAFLLTFYGGFIILFLLACIGAVVSAAPVRPPRPGPLPSAGRR